MKILNDYEHQLLYFNNTLKKFNYEMEMDTKDLSKITGRMEINHRDKNTNDTVGKNSGGHFKELEGLNSHDQNTILHTAVTNKIRLLRTKEFQSKTVQNDVEARLLKLQRYTLYLGLSAFLGLIVLLFGFYNWHKIQKAQFLKIATHKSRFDA